ncbi:FAD-dependent oxidoreductase [Beduinella massiliensis]|uniref:FAD-dependent oxidoreductase n=1 Tax=Beduinella massiliensis TaxID=1852363 RepID=UPI000C81FD11
MKKLFTLMLVLALALAMAMPAGADWVRPAVTVETWDEEADFVIVGFGLAGAAAAVEAHDIDPNAKVVVLEKMPESLAGGNSIASGQTFIVPSEAAVADFKLYLQACNEPNAIPDEYLNWLVNGFATQLPWIEGVAESAGYEAGYVGGGELKWGSMVLEFDSFPGSNFDGASAHLRKKNSGAFENGGVWRCFAEAAKARNIEVRYENPAIALVQDPVTREVSGVVATDAEGKEYTIKSAKGVLLACGGYENNLEMQRDFHGMDEVYTAGTPGNTGDGIKMLMEAGAKIWHMKNQTQSGGFWLGIKVPEHEATFMRNFSMAGNSWIEIDSDNSRFYDEAYGYHRQHMKYMEYGRYVDLPHERALPVHLIFDEATREAGSIASQWLSWPTTTEGYMWSSDNLAEIEKGWIVKADTVAELAEKIGRDPEALQATIDRYNELCEKGVDEDFGRDPEKMAKIEKGPFYAVAITPTLVATTGGAKRDTAGRVLDWNENPIPGLYEAGELGSYVSNLYQNGVFLSEAMLSGRAAAQTAFGGASEVKAVVKETAAGPAWAEAADGEYVQVVDGLHDKIEVKMTVQDGKLTAIAIGEGRDEMFITDEQLEQYVGAILASQSADVDIVSGATIDCQAIGTAIAQAFAK